ncbi:MAG: hypothetical protein ABEJ30_03730 [Halorientalis sp.]
MASRRLVLATVLLVAVAGGVAVLTPGLLGGGGVDGGGSGGTNGGATDTPQPTGTVYTQSADGGGGGGSETRSPPFSFDIEQIEKCGQTCRDVTVTLDNDQNTTATGVTVFTRIYAGNTTDQDARVWNGEEDVGTMDPASNVTRTERVDLSMSEAFAVQQHDGWITVVTTVSSDDTTITFKSRRNVA